MLNLLNKTDKPSELRTGMHLGCKDESPLSEVPQIENCNLSYNPSTTSQGLGLGLSPSSQQIPKSYSALGFPIVVSGKISTFANFEFAEDHNLIVPPFFCVPPYWLKHIVKRH